MVDLIVVTGVYMEKLRQDKDPNGPGSGLV